MLALNDYLRKFCKNEESSLFFLENIFCIILKSQPMFWAKIWWKSCFPWSMVAIKLAIEILNISNKTPHSRSTYRNK